MAKKIKNLWGKKLSVETVQHKSVVNKIKRIHANYLNVMKSINRPHFAKSRQSFRIENDSQLFDISVCKCDKTCVCDVQMSRNSVRILNNQRSTTPAPLADLYDNNNNDSSSNDCATEDAAPPPRHSYKRTFKPSIHASVDANAKRATRSRRVIESSPVKRIQLDSVAAVIDRFGITERGAASLISAAYVDANVNIIVDKSKIRRAIQKARSVAANNHLSELRKFINTSECYGIFFDGKKDECNSMQQNPETLNYHRRSGAENHYALVIQPGDQFFAHVTTSDSTSKTIFESIVDKIEREQFDTTKIFFVGCDGTVTNTGHLSG